MLSASEQLSSQKICFSSYLERMGSLRRDKDSGGRFKILIRIFFASCFSFHITKKQSRPTNNINMKASVNRDSTSLKSYSSVTLFTNKNSCHSFVTERNFSTDKKRVSASRTCPPRLPYQFWDSRSLGSI